MNTIITNPLNKNILTYIAGNTVATLATVDDNNAPWCNNIFYTFNEEDYSLIFLSYPDTHHSKLLLKHNIIAGTITEQFSSVIKIQGVQFTGRAYRESSRVVRKVFTDKFPFTMISNATLWKILLDRVKYTSNIISFGKKEVWQRSINT